MLSLSVILLTIGGLALAGPLPLPDYVTACSRNDPNLNSCVLKQAIKAVPLLVKGDRKYRVPVLDPLVIPEIVVENNGNSGMGLSITMRDVSIHGARNVQLRKTDFDLKNKKIEISGMFPRVDIRSNLNVTGQILVLPIRGTGKSWMNLTDVDVTYTSDFKLVEKGGRDYLILENDDLKFQTSNLRVKLENLLNNDKLLVDGLNDFLNENWKDVVKDVSPPVAKAFGTAFTHIVTSVAGLVPYDVLFPDIPV